MNLLLKLLSDKLGETLILDETTRTIYNQDNRRLYRISKNRSKITFIGKWLNKEKRWKYIFAAYEISKMAQTDFSKSQLNDFLHYFLIENELLENDIYSAVSELNDLFQYLGSNYQFSFLNKEFKKLQFIYIQGHEENFQINWYVNQEHWKLEIGKVHNPNMVTKYIPRGNLVHTFDTIIQDFLNYLTLNKIFGESEAFSSKYPLLCKYLKQNYYFYNEKDLIGLCHLVQNKLNIIPQQLESELASKFKKQTIHSVIFSMYRLGGEDVFVYSKIDKKNYCPDQIFFKKRME